MFESLLLNIWLLPFASVLYNSCSLKCNLHFCPLLS
nr:MAG TPA: hypothetical protein [Caudoviricetes sp.]